MSAANFDFSKNAMISRQLASEGMVLLKNQNNVLPLQGKSIALFGRAQIDYYQGGGGSSKVRTAYTVSLLDGLENAEKEGNLKLDHKILDCYRKDPEFFPTKKQIEESAKKCSTAVFTLSRDSREHYDCLAEPGDFYPTETEIRLLDALKKSSFREIVVLVNTGRVISLSFVAKCDRVDGLVILWQPGMEGGNALADLLTGKINFSGKLADTFAGDFSDYPCRDFSKYWTDESYDEGIFVGYRYFETIPGAAEKVLYPFGFGLSYTTFKIEKTDFSAEGKNICVTCQVTNTGKVSGREVVQLYLARKGGALEHPAKELIAFAKTKELAPGKSQKITLKADKEFALRSFDDTGVCGKPGSWILDRGTAEFLLGNSVRNTVSCGRIKAAKITVLSSPGNLFSVGPERQLHSDGTYTEFFRTVNNVPTPALHGPDKPTWKGKPIMLIDVAEKRASMKDFISQLTIDEKIALCQGQPEAFPDGTAGIGNLPKYGIPNPQTADGPAGLRKAVNTTCFPSEILLACTWNTETVKAMGKALGFEGISTGVDILLAPGLNIHRSPLCGRCFEYYSEDPLISGKMASAMVQGVQSQGMGATIKHFALNNRERVRHDSSSLATDRTIREIYLKGFEIAIKEGKPWCIMSSYNKINQLWNGSNYHLLTTVLRKEWGFDGLVMSDWHTHALFHAEIAAGNDLKMPFCDVALANSKWYMKQSDYPVERLNESVRHVLELVMKTALFKKRVFNTVWTLAKGAYFDVRAVDYAAISAKTVRIAPSTEDGIGSCLTDVTPIKPAKPCRITYEMESDAKAEFLLQLIAAARCEGTQAEVFINGKRQGKITIAKSRYIRWQLIDGFMLTVPKGRFTLELVFPSLPAGNKGKEDSLTELYRIIFLPPKYLKNR